MDLRVKTPIVGKFGNRFIKFEGNEFKSMLEKRTYQILKEAGFAPKYEPTVYEIFPGFKLNDSIVFYKPYKSTQKTLSKRRVSFAPITYTPDFIFEYHGYLLIFDAKGKANDTYPMKVKMLLYKLFVEAGKQVVFFEPHSLRQVKQSVEIIKNLPYTH